MRSPTGVVSAITLLLAVPLALAAQTVSDGSAELVLHLAIGTGSVLLAIAMWDFPLGRLATAIGSAAAAAFGAIFMLQALSQLVPSDALAYVAFEVLGQQIERVLPYVIVGWFLALLLWGSAGKSRILGAATLAVVIAVEIASMAGSFVGLAGESQKILFLLPFVWLLVESLEEASTIDHGRIARQHEGSTYSTGHPARFT
jgi:hypothetical protein